MTTTPVPDPLAYGPTGYQCGCGKDAHSNLVPCAVDTEPAAPAVGQRYTNRTLYARTVTVTHVWTDDDGRTAVAFDIPGTAPGGSTAVSHSALPLGVFLGTYEPVATPEPTVTVTAAQLEAALRGYLAILDYDLHKNLECGEETGEDTYAEEADDLFARLRDAQGSAA